MTSARFGSGFGWFASVALSFALTACATAGSKAGAPAPAAEYPSLGPKEVAPKNDLRGGASSELDQAEADLDRALGSRSGFDKKKDSPSKSAEAPATAPRPGAAADSDGAPDTSACADACKALGSMDRAAAHLCDLAGDGDPACQGARDRVSRSRDRVMAACGACAGP